MIDDFGGDQQRRTLKKTKTISPREQKEFGPLPILDDETSSEPDFQPPETVAVFESPVVDPIESTTGGDADTSNEAASELRKSTRRLSFSSWRWPLHRKGTIIAASVAVLLIGGGTAAAIAAHHSPKPAAVVVVTPKPKPVPPKPVIIYSTLSGLPVADNSVNQRPVTGVMIENSDDARPQSGINQAGVVFEAIAEGGITRFLTLYQDQQPDYLGPVRSARPYYLQWCMGFDCSLAHVGGSPEALQDIKSWSVKDLDQFYNSAGYERISSRYAPHNVYTSTAQLNQLETAKGYGASSFTGFPRKADTPSKTPNAASIDFAISSVDFNAHFDYNAVTDSYKRSEAGATHNVLNKDGSQVQLTPKVVVAMIMQYGLEADDHHSQYNVIGSGQAFVFQDGVVTTATWTKTDAKSQVTFADAAGKPIAFNRGQTWLTALSASNQVVYK